MMPFVVVLLVLLAGSALSLAFRRFPVLASWLGTGSVVAGSVLGLAFAVRILWMGASLSYSVSWPLPYATLSLGVDPMSAFFMLPLFILSPLAALYGAAYLRHGAHAVRRGEAGFFLNLLVASMALVMAARNTVLFLVAWEVMALSSFAMVVFDREDESARDAGWSYLVASQAGTAFLFFLFLLMGRGAMGFDDFAAPDSPRRAALLYLLAVVGFGTKAGFMPLHIWLPRAHPAAPSHISALMSAVMIKMGIYGLVRTLMILGPLPVWCAYVMIGLGISSGVLGVILALAQQDIKKVLAYSSVENIGIIALGLGLGMLGRAIDQPALAFLGFAAALLHVLNHALFKGLLFFGAGSIAHVTHTRDLDVLGGLGRRMPWTAATFLAGSAAICGLPVLNGFVGEFLLYLGSFRALAGASAGPALAAVGILLGLALIGGLGVACFTRVFSAVFLGQPRSAAAERGSDPGILMTGPMVLLALACFAIGLAGPVVVRALAGVTGSLAGCAGASCALPDAMWPLYGLTMLLGCTLLLGLFVAVTRRSLLAGRDVREADTWGCGYTAASARMQYTATSFAAPLTHFFGGILRVIRAGGPVRGLFPEPSQLATRVPDVFEKTLFGRPARWVVARMTVLRKFQHGRMNLYVLYIALTLLALMLWKLT